MTRRNSSSPALSSALQSWRDQADHLTDRGHAIAFWRGGDWSRADVPTLLLIHGFPTASYDWVRLWPELASRFRVLAVDMLGFGFSAKPRDHAYSIVDQAGVLERVIDHLGVPIDHVLAHDYGDTVAQELMARRAEDPSRPGFKSVCLLNGGLFPETHHPTFIQRLLASPLGPLVSSAMTAKRFGRGFSEVFGPDTKPSPDELADFWALATLNGGMPAIGHKLIGYMAERRALRERWVGALIKAPHRVRVIDGALDPVSGAHMTRRYRELAPDADIVLLEQVGHYPQWEAPQETLAAFLDFNPGRDPREPR